MPDLGETRILRWNSSRILGHLARRFRGADRQTARSVSRAYHRHKLIAGAKTIQAPRTLRSPSRISPIASPARSSRRAAHYATPECRNVAAGHAIQALDRFFEHIQNKKAVLDFVESQLKNSRPATRKKAEKFWAKWAGW